MGYFRIVPNLCFKARLSAKLLIWKWFFHKKGFALSLVLKVRVKELKMAQYTPNRLSLHSKKSQRSFQSAFRRTTIATNTVKNNTYTSRWWINKGALFITINVCIWKLKYIFGYKRTASTTWLYLEYNICLFRWNNAILIRLNRSVFWMNVVFFIFIF